MSKVESHALAGAAARARPARMSLQRTRMVDLLACMNEALVGAKWNSTGVPVGPVGRRKYM